MSTMGIVSLSPLPKSKLLSAKPLPLQVLLQIISVLKRSVFSRKFYAEINDKILSKTSTLDSMLYFICYFTLLMSSVLNNKPRIKQFLRQQKYNLLQVIRSVVLKTSNKDLALSSNKLVKRTFDASNDPKNAPAETESTEPVSKLAVHLKAISSYIADVRIFNRLTDSIKYMPWAIDEFKAWMDPTNPVAKLDRFVNFLQAFNCIVLELLENAGWLTDHNWVGTSDNAWWSIETYIWCCRVWGAYLVIEIIELIRRTPVSKMNGDWKIALFKQVIQVPLVLHWSLYDGCLTPFWVGVCGSGASWWNFKALLDSLDF